MTRMAAWTARARAAWTARLATPAGRREAILLALGLAGWILIVLNYPFGWALPEYATY